jgi:hypothetical protein
MFGTRLNVVGRYELTLTGRSRKNLPGDRYEYNNFSFDFLGQQ